MADPTTPAASLTDEGLEIVASGLPYLGGWGTGAPWVLTPEALTQFRGRMLAMATHEHAHCFDPEQAGLGYVETVPPLVQLVGYMFEALHGPFAILDKGAYSDVLADFKVAGFPIRRTIGVTVWPPSFNWLVFVWQILRTDNDIATTTHVIRDALEVIADIPPLAEVVEECGRLMDTVLNAVPRARLEAADDHQLEAFFADALDDRGAQVLPWLRGSEFALASLAQKIEASAGAIAAVDLILPTLEELLVSELVLVDGSVTSNLRTALGGAAFMRVRERVAAGDITDVDRAEISNTLARAVRAGEADEAHQWATAVYRILAAARDSSDQTLFPSAIALEDFADDLADIVIAQRAQHTRAQDDVSRVGTLQVTRDQPARSMVGDDEVTRAGHGAPSEARASHADGPAADGVRLGGSKESAASDGVGESSDADLDDPWTRLDRMVGLSGVKSTVRRALRGAELAQRRCAAGITLKPPARHLLFLGNPGTGKTEVARLIGEIYRDRGVLRTGKLIEASRADLVGEGIGETAPKVRKEFAAARGGVLFIDEARNGKHTSLAKEVTDECHSEEAREQCAARTSDEERGLSRVREDWAGGAR